MVFSHQSKTTTRQKLNLCIPMMPFAPDMSGPGVNRLVVVLGWCENSIRPTEPLVVDFREIPHKHSR